MKTLNRVPERLPNEPTLIRAYDGLYHIWTGRSWHGSIERVRGRGWEIVTPGAYAECLSSFNIARAEAEHRARRAEGRS